MRPTPHGPIHAVKSWFKGSRNGDESTETTGRSWFHRFIPWKTTSKSATNGNMRPNGWFKNGWFRSNKIAPYPVEDDSTSSSSKSGGSANDPESEVLLIEETGEKEEAKQGKTDEKTRDDAQEVDEEYVLAVSSNTGKLGVAREGQEDEEKVVDEVKCVAEEGRKVYLKREADDSEERNGLNKTKPKSTVVPKPMDDKDDKVCVIPPEDLKSIYWAEGVPAAIGQGVSGKVYLRELHGQLVAEKVFDLVPTDAHPEKKRRRRVMREALAHSAVSGIPGIAKFYGVVDRDPVDALVMEYLGDVHTRRGPSLTKAEVIKDLIDIATAIRAQQKQGWLHCDIKTDNVMLVNEKGSWSGKVIDFGLSEKYIDKPTVEYTPFDPTEYEENAKEYPFVAPEILFAVSGDTLATETYALGFMFDELGTSQDISSIRRLGEICMSKNPELRPSMDLIIIHLQDLLKKEL